jgi:hypothetical protein
MGYPNNKKIDCKSLKEPPAIAFHETWPGVKGLAYKCTVVV